MARISYAKRNDVPKRLHHLFDDMSTYGPFGSLVGAMAHRPPIFEHVFGMLTELRKEGVLPRRYLELALVAVSKLNQCEYCVAHHSPFLTIEGVSPLGTDTILDYQDHPEFDEVDKIVVAEQYIDNDSLLTLLKSDLYNIAFNPIFEGEKDQGKLLHLLNDR